MPADDQMMSLLNAQQGGAGAIPPPEQGMSQGVSDSSTPPMASPMSTPEPKIGNKEGALVNISMAMDLIEQALPSIGSETDEGQKALMALKTLSGILGPRKGNVRDLQQSEIIQMLQNLPKAGGGTPEGQAMSQAPVVPNMPPMPGAGGGGAPMPQAGGAPSPQSLPI